MTGDGPDVTFTILAVRVGAQRKRSLYSELLAPVEMTGGRVRLSWDDRGNEESGWDAIGSRGLVAALMERSDEARCGG